MAAEGFVILDQAKWDTTVADAIAFGAENGPGLRKTTQVYREFAEYFLNLRLLCQSQKFQRPDWGGRSAEYRDTVRLIMKSVVPPIDKAVSEWSAEDHEDAKKRDRQRDSISEGIRYHVAALIDERFKLSAREKIGLVQGQAPTAEQRKEIDQIVREEKIEAGLAREGAPESSANKKAEGSEQSETESVKAGPTETAHQMKLKASTLVGHLDDHSTKFTVEQIDECLKECNDTMTLVKVAVPKLQGLREGLMEAAAKKAEKAAAAAAKKAETAA